ncbi:MAG: GNAT family N-acetyltransferase, partial [Metallosphaera sp.]
ADGLYLVARLGEQIVGYCIGIVQFKTRGHVVSIATLKTARNRGIGSALLNELEERFKKLGCTYSYLEVNVNNSDAIRFYFNRSYKVIRTRKNYYGRNRNGFVMLKDLRSVSGHE